MRGRWVGYGRERRIREKEGWGRHEGEREKDDTAYKKSSEDGVKEGDTHEKGLRGESERTKAEETCRDTCGERWMRLQAQNQRHTRTRL